MGHLYAILGDNPHLLLVEPVAMGCNNPVAEEANLLQILDWPLTVLLYTVFILLLRLCEMEVNQHILFIGEFPAPLKTLL